MVINSLKTLTAAVIDQMDRPDLEPLVPQFAAAAEQRFNEGLRAREMEDNAPEAGTTENGVTSMGLPADFLEWIVVRWKGSSRIAWPTYAEPNSPEVRHAHRPGGDPQYFTIRANQIHLVPAKPGIILLTYYKAIPPLTDANSTNWLIQKAPSAYLYATLAEAYLYQKAPDLSQAHMTLALQSLQANGIKADTAKVARRPARQAEVAASTQARDRPE